MGFLTTLTFYNDGVDLLTEHAEDFSKRVHEVATGFTYSPVEIPLGSFANFAKVQRSRHADDNTVYVHCGNTVCEMNCNSEETKRIMKQNPAFFAKMLEEMKKQVEILEGMKNGNVR
jgi:hypothetical protein